jgi:hypothetical protein
MTLVINKPVFNTGEAGFFAGKFRPAGGRFVSRLPKITTDSGLFRVGGGGVVDITTRCGPGI